MKTISLFPTPSEWLPPQSFPDLSSATEIAIDLETCDPNLEKYGPGWPRKDGYIIGYAVAVDGWRGYYPIAHQGGGNLDKKIVERWIKDVLLLPADKIMHNAAYDVGWLKASGFTINGKIIDTMLAAALIDENRFSYALNSLGFDMLKEIKSEQGLREAAADFGVSPKKDMWKLPAMYVGEYAEQDAALTLKLWHYLKTALRREEVESIFELELELLPILIGMTYQGIRFDREKASQLIDQMQAREKTLLTQIKKTAGVGVDIWAAASIAIAFDKIGVGYPKSKTGLPSFTKSFLDSCDHPLAKVIVEAREINKTYGTFLQPYLDFSEADGRIHPHANQLRSDDGGTVTGRLSMNSPNLQQVPSRHPIIGPAIRGLFLPEEGELWASNDFSSQEPRLLVHYAHLLGLPGVESVVENYKNDPETDFYQIVANAAGIERKVAKTCIAEGQLVLTHRGLVPIELVEMCDKVWDGISWVEHGGVVYMGEKEVITYGNLTATPDHDVWTIQSGKIPFGLAASRLDALVSTGNAEQAVRYVDGDEQRNTAQGQASIRQGAVRLWQRGLEALRQLEEWKINYVPPLYYAQSTQEHGSFACYHQNTGLTSKKSQRYFRQVSKLEQHGLPRLRWAWDYLRIHVGQGVGRVLVDNSFGRAVGKWSDRPDRQRQELCEGESPMHLSLGEQREPKKHSFGFLQRVKNLCESCLALDKNGLSRLRIYPNLDGKTNQTGYIPRRPTHVSEKGRKTEKVYDILNAGSRHRFTVSGVLVSNCSLGMMYGMGKAKLATQLEMDSDEAGDLIKEFHGKVPFLRGTIDAVMRRIEQPASGGAIRTLLGRKCRFPLWEPMQWGINKALPYEEAVAKYGPRVKRAMTYKGLNRLIQGSAADQTKAAMVALHKAGYRVLLQVHDELALSVQNKEQAQEAARLMANAVQLEIPSKVDVEIGTSWGKSMG